MKEFSAALVREKIILVDEARADRAEKGTTAIRSNRISLQLPVAGGAIEQVVVRAQSMHVTLRLASKVMMSYFKTGAFLTREEPYDWQSQWESSLSEYETTYNPEVWGSVYINGSAAFKTDSSSFMDVIEQCAQLTRDNYDATMSVTEDAMKRIGRAVSINHAVSVASVLTDKDNEMRCGIIMRLGGSDATFNLSASGGSAEVRIVQSINIVASFLEGINLRHRVQSLQTAIRREDAPQFGNESLQIRRATARLIILDKAITAFEGVFKVKYRPSKPQFFDKT